MTNQRLIIVNCGQLITMQPLALARRYTQIKATDLGLLGDAWLAIESGVVIEFASGTPPQKYRDWQKIDAQGLLVTPGMIDCHTHPIFGGNRSHEFAQRLLGASYQDIAAAGGGIKFTIEATRAASSQQLMDSTLARLKVFLSHGVTTVEVKTGYGQSVDEELRHVRILKNLAMAGPQTLSITCLALHDRPHDQPDKTSFIQKMTDELLPILAREQLVDWIDAFVEDGYFSVTETENFLQKAQHLGLKIRIHADEFQDSGAAAAAARWGAASADHLQEAHSQGIAAMAAAETVAVILPGTSFYSRLAYAQAEKFRQQNCPIAVASDFNPGSCPMSNLPFVASLAALYCGLSAPEAMVGVTWNAARALRLDDRKGALAPAYDADVVIHGVATLDQWIADFGQTPVKNVLIGGKLMSH